MAIGDLYVDTVTTGATGIDLIEQFEHLCFTGGHLGRAFEPMAQDVGLTLASQHMQKRNLRRLAHGLRIDLRQLIKQQLALGRMASRAGQRFPKKWKRVGPGRQQPCSDPVAGEAQITIAGIVDKGLPFPDKCMAQIPRSHAQQGTAKGHTMSREKLTHCRQAWQTCASAECDHHGFGLVIGMLAQQNTHGV